MHIFHEIYRQKASSSGATFKFIWAFLYVSVFYVDKESKYLIKQLFLLWQCVRKILHSLEGRWLFGYVEWYQYIKDWKVEICKGGSIDSRHREDQQSTQRRSTLLILGGADQWSMWRGSTVNFNFHVKRQLLLLILEWGQINDQCSMQRGSTVNVERVSTQCREDQQSM